MNAITPSPTEQTCFMTMYRSQAGEKLARLLVESLRAFGGPLKDSPVWVFLLDPDKVSRHFPGIDNMHFFPLAMGDKIPRYLFAEKVAACAQAEAMAYSSGESGQIRSLVWMDVSCLVVTPPLLFELAPPLGAAFRPVHHKNVGPLAEEPLDEYWQAIYQAVGLDEAPFTIETFVDALEIRPYFNTHLFAVDPGKGLLGAWLELFERMVADQAFQAGPCGDELHQIFLHQATLSALVAKTLPRESIRLLPPEYSYPLHMHTQVPPARQAPDLNSLVCPVYEGLFSYPETLNGLQVLEPLEAWLRAKTDW